MMDDLVSDSDLSQFRSPDVPFGGLDAGTAAALVAAATDIALVIGDDGVIRDLSCSNASLLSDGIEEWLGQAWLDTVTVESRSKVESMLRDAVEGESPRWRQVNYSVVEGPDLPINYLALPIGKEGLVLALGRELRSFAALQQQLVHAQQGLEREYMRLRHTETRYRVLFQMASEAVLIVDASTRKVVDANPAAIQLLGATAGQLIGQKFPEDIDGEDRELVVELFSGIRKTGKVVSESAKVRLNDQQFRVSASLFRQGNKAHFLVRLSALADADQGAATVQKSRSRLLDVIETMPDGFVATDVEGRILAANSAFLDLAQLATEEQALGQSIGRWLGRSDIDLGVLAQVRRQHAQINIRSAQPAADRLPQGLLFRC